MNSGKILKLAQILLKIAMGVCIGFFVLHAFLFIHSSVSPGSYEKLLVKQVMVGFEFYYKLNLEEQAKTIEEWNAAKMDGYYYYNKLTTGSKMKILVYFTVVLLISLIVFKYLLGLFKNVKDYSSFFVSKSELLKKIGYVLLIGSIVQFLFLIFINQIEMVIPENNYITFHNVSINLSLPVFGLVAFVACMLLSNIFQEGERLRKENELTI